MQNKLVSIVCPMHNCEKFVKDTVNCVLSQTHPIFELLIIDDCSSDKTVELLKEFNDPRIKILVNDKNSGAAFSRNRAIAAAKGEYIAFLDGDDLWSNDKLEKQLSFMETNGYVFSYTDYEVVDECGNSLNIYYVGPKKVTHKKFLRIDYIGTSTVMYRRDIYPNLSIPDDLYKRNDDALWLLLSTRADCYRMEGIYSKYRKVSGSISSGKKSKLFQHHVYLYQRLYGFGKFKARLFALRNVFFYFLKQITYKKHLKKQKVA